MNAFLTRPIEGDWPYLWIDATYLKVREAGRIVSVAVIIAVAVNTDGVEPLTHPVAAVQEVAVRLRDDDRALGRVLSAANYAAVLPADISAGALDEAVARLKELHAAYREEYAAYYDRHATPDSPAMRGADPAIVLVPGASTEGKDDARLVAFGEAGEIGPVDRLAPGARR